MGRGDGGAFADTTELAGMAFAAVGEAALGAVDVEFFLAGEVVAAAAARVGFGRAREAESEGGEKEDEEAVGVEHGLHERERDSAAGPDGENEVEVTEGEDAGEAEHEIAGADPAAAVLRDGEEDEEGVCDEQNHPCGRSLRWWRREGAEIGVWLPEGC